MDTLQQRCTATDAQAAQLQQQLTDLHADKALLGARLHDGSLDMVKGQLIQQLQQQLTESSLAAESSAAVSQQASAQVQRLQDQLALLQQAQASERERLSMEAAQSRLLCKARARQVSTLELQYKAQVSNAPALRCITHDMVCRVHNNGMPAVKRLKCKLTTITRCIRGHLKVTLNEHLCTGCICPDSWHGSHLCVMFFVGIHATSQPPA